MLLYHISLCRIRIRPEEARETAVNETGVTVGAALSLRDMKVILDKYIQEMPQQKTRLFRETIKALEPTESEQILNLAVSILTGVSID